MARKKRGGGNTSRIGLSGRAGDKITAKNIKKFKSLVKGGVTLRGDKLFISAANSEETFVGKGDKNPARLAMTKIRSSVRKMKSSIAKSKKTKKKSK